MESQLIESSIRSADMRLAAISAIGVSEFSYLLISSFVSHFRCRMQSLINKCCSEAKTTFKIEKLV